MKILFLCICLSTVFWVQSSQGASALRAVEKEASVLLRRVPVRTIVPRFSPLDVWKIFTPGSVQVRHLSIAASPVMYEKTEEEFNEIKKLNDKIEENCIPTLLKSQIDAVSSVGRVADNFKVVIDQFIISSGGRSFSSAPLMSNTFYLEEFSTTRSDFIRHLDNKLDEIKASLDDVDQEQKKGVVDGLGNILSHMRIVSKLLDMGTIQIDKLINKAREAGLIKDEKVSPVPVSPPISSKPTPLIGERV